MKHGSLFSGIGGFDLASEWMGWDNIFHCEWNPFGQKVLKHHFPKSISYNDITKTDFSIHKGNIDILTGGFPCQPYSTAGLRKGKADERHLFPEMLRAIKEIQPKWIIGENVRGLVSWGGGLVFNEVCDDLEREGYEVQSFLIPAASVNAPHKRERIWFVAYSDRDDNVKQERRINEETQTIQGEHWQENNPSREFIGTNKSNNVTNSNDKVGFKQGSYICEWSNEKQEPNNRNDLWNNIRTTCEKSYATNSKSIGQEYALENGELEGGRFRKSYKRDMWDSFPSQPPICGGNDGIPRELDSITFSKWRNESIKGYGNAIVPQVAYQIFKTIKEFEDLIK